MRRHASRVTGPGALAGLLLVAAAALVATAHAQAVVDCGEQFSLELEPGLWSVVDAPVQSNKPLANGGPNYIKASGGVMHGEEGIEPRACANE